MAKNKLSVPIRREIDKQKLIQFLSSSDEFGFYFSTRYRDERDLEEEERKWREDIQNLKKILAEYQKVNSWTPTQPSKVE